MYPFAVILALVLASGSVPPHRATQGLWTTVAQVERQHRLPVGLLRAVVLVESRGCPRALGINANGSCDVGPAQINVPGCHVWDVVPLLDLRSNLRRAAQILTWSARACRASPGRLGCSQCIWGRYNPRSRTWCARVARYWRRRVAS